MTEHQWIKHVMTPVSVLPDDDGDPVVFVDPDIQTMSEEAAVYGCAVCNEPMVTHHGKPCAGPDLENS